MSASDSKDEIRTGVRVEDDRTSMEPEALERAVLDHLHFTCCKDRMTTTPLDLYHAVAHATRDRLIHRWIKTQRAYYEKNVKRVYYLSAEFLMGRALSQNLINLGLFELSGRLLAKRGVALVNILEEEVDPGLGNGGLGRLAACFLESMATLSLPGAGYGIRYEFGIFDQKIVDGRQVERADAWLRSGNPWEIARHEHTVPVRFYGHVEPIEDEDGKLQMHWVDTQEVLGVPYETPIAGYGNDTVNTLRLWSARASREFNLQVFNDGDYRRAVEEKALSESISKVLYPNDDSLEGRELRLKQQYFFVACSIQDILRRYKKSQTSLDALPDKVAIQLNDTHPAIAVAELMRVLIDQEGFDWEPAWRITHRTLAFTNHTLLPEALERWPVSLFERLLPRHLQIIYEINHRFLLLVHVHGGGDDAMKARMSIIEEGSEKKIRMAHLAVIGSHHVNGVAKMHSDLVRTQLFHEFASLWPEKFNNKTNGVSPRRWLLVANPLLSACITRRIGRGWIRDLTELEKLLPLAEDGEFQVELRHIKQANKRALARLLRERHGFEADVEGMFVSQVKRIHEYKRQLLNCLHIVSLYQEIRRDPSVDRVPQTFVFGGKAAPGYAMAKLHIKLINDVAAMINSDPRIRGLLKVAFVANYSVSLAELIIPATDVSVQISMAGKEASGTGNMKFSMNGALTVGTLDGANVEIREAVGEENFFLFGLTAPQVLDLKRSGYDPSVFTERSQRLHEALDLVASGYFSPNDPERFHPIIDSIRQHDPYLLCADFEAYAACQEEAARVFRDPTEWSRRVVHNLANMGRFSSDRTIQQYAEEIWGVLPHPITLTRVTRTFSRGRVAEGPSG